MGGILYLESNGSLTDLSGLGGIRQIDAGLVIRFLDSLTDLSGFESLLLINGEVEITDNAALCQSVVEAWAEAVTIGLRGSSTLCCNDSSC